MAATFESALNHFITECSLVVKVHNLMTKWRIELKGGYILDLYFNSTNKKYSYTLTKDENRILGWDNAPHHPGQSNFPHHFHSINGLTGPSDLIGDPENDLELVRVKIEDFLSAE